jgi:low affinity Fe/Cu permease
MELLKNPTRSSENAMSQIVKTKNEGRPRAGTTADDTKPTQSSAKQRVSKFFGDVANYTAHAAGRPSIFILAAGTILVWAVSGPYFDFSDTWQLVINTGTTIVTFLMVFLIQNSQNRDGAAIQVKLDELIRVSAAHNKFVGVEHLTDEELDEIRTKCEKRAKGELQSQAARIRPEKKSRAAAR